MRFTRTRITFCIVASIVLLAAGCTIIGKTQEESELIELDRVELLNTRISMDMGKLKVSDGTDQLLEADFTYNVASWKPRIDYKKEGIRGELVVEQPSGARGIPLGRANYQWDLRLNKDIPMDLDINLGAGSSDLKLGNLLLDKLEIKNGAGNTKLDLTGRPSLSSLNLDIGAGDIAVDMRGSWKDDLEASIVGGVGNVQLQLPRNVGVRVNVQRGVGDINIKGLTREGSAYVNRVYGQTTVTLDIDIKAGVGEIDLELE